MAVVVTYYYLEIDNDKVLKIPITQYSYFEINKEGNTVNKNDI